MPCLRALENEEIENQVVLERFRHYASTRGFVPNSIRTMARRPGIVNAFMALNQAVLFEGTVAEELKMLVSLVVSMASGCLYCQSHMTNLASIYLASDDKIAALADFENSELFSDAERAAINLAFKAGRLPNEAALADFDRLAKHFDEGEIVEIVATIGLFGYLNRWNDTLATTLEPLPKAAVRRVLGGNWDEGKHR